MRRCRRARQELFARFKTQEELHAWLMSLEKEQGPRRMVRIGKAQAHKKVKPPARIGKPANGKTVRKG
ncbi:MAG: hypothetical protein ABSE73_15400 [Planctomycetota bacterium]